MQLLKKIAFPHNETETSKTRTMAWRPGMPPMRHDAPRAFGMGDRPLPYGAGAAPYGPPYTNIFRPPGVPSTSQFIAPSRPVVASFPSSSGAASSSTGATATAAASAAKAAEALAQQQAADDKKRGYPTIKGKAVAQCKRKICGNEELKVLAVMLRSLCFVQSHTTLNNTVAVRWSPHRS